MEAERKGWTSTRTSRGGPRSGCQPSSSNPPTREVHNNAAQGRGAALRVHLHHRLLYVYTSVG